MKTLDEVIYWYENRRSILIDKATKEEMEDAIIYHLKNYREVLNALKEVFNGERE